MMTDYKISGMVEKDGLLTIKVRVYEGDITMKQERVEGRNQNVTRYRRTKMLREETYTVHTGERGAADALSKFKRDMNERLKGDPARTPIPEQTSA